MSDVERARRDLVDSGAVEARTFNRWVQAWEDEGPKNLAFVRYLARIGVMKASAEPLLEPWLRGYAAIPLQQLLDSDRIGPLARGTQPFVAADVLAQRPAVASPKAEARKTPPPIPPGAYSRPKGGARKPLSARSRPSTAARALVAGALRARELRVPPAAAPKSVDGGVPARRHVGDLCGNYVITGMLGTGATADVYRGAAPDGTSVVLKVVHALPDSEAAERLVREAQVLTALDNDHVLRVLDRGSCEGSVYLVFEDQQAITLAELCEGPGALPVSAVMSIGRQLCNALDAASARGVIHGDVSPGNVLIVGSDFRVQLSDFGISRLADETVTQPSKFRGTPAFIAPEKIAAPSRAGTSADMYSLGALLYFAARGSPPFEGSNPMAVIRGHLYEPAPSLPVTDPASEQLSAVVARLLRKRPAERYDAWAAIALDLTPRPTARSRR